MQRQGQPGAADDGAPGPQTAPTIATQVYSLGHSTRSLDELIALLREHGIAFLVDVRRFPVSRRHPQFTRETLEQALRCAGIDYLHELDLGGHRTPRPDSPNTAWRVPAFRGYADYMSTPAFSAALDRLCARASERALAVLCAEAVPWKCHRQLLADALVARGLEVRHILGPGRTEPHALHAAARVTDTGVSYPARGEAQLRLPIAGGHEPKQD